MHKNNMSTAATLIALVIVISGCASIVSKSSYPVVLDSDPDGATITVVNKSGDTIVRSTTPTSVTLKASKGFFSKEEYTLTYQKDGYAKQIVKFSAGIDGWYFGNLLFGGLPGLLIIDPLTGSMWKLDGHINANLSQQVSHLSPELKILERSQIPEEWNQHLVKLN